MIKLQLSQHMSRDKNILSRDMSFMSRRKGDPFWPVKNWPVIFWPVKFGQLFYAN